MPTLQFCIRDGTNRQEVIRSCSLAANAADPVASKAIGPSTSHADPECVPLAHCEPLLDTRLSSGYGTNNYGNTCHSSFLGAQGARYCRDQQQTRTRIAPYNMTVRLTNQSIGAPLSTITEQGSYSTLNSHGCPPNIGGHPSIRINDNTLFDNYSRRIDQRVPQEDATSNELTRHTRQEDNKIDPILLSRPVSTNYTCTALPIRPYSHESQVLDDTSTPNSLGDKRLKRLLQCVRRNFWGNFQDYRSRSFSTINLPSSNIQEERLNASGDILLLQHANNNISSQTKEVGTGTLTLSSRPQSITSLQLHGSSGVEGRNHTRLVESSINFNTPPPHFLPAVSEDGGIAAFRHFLQALQSPPSPGMK